MSGTKNVLLRKIISPVEFVVRHIHAMSRSWVICCVDYPALSVAALTVLSVLAILIVFNTDIAFLDLIILFAVGMLSGMFLTGKDFQLFLRRANQISSSPDPEDQRIDTEIHGTGLKLLDSLIESQGRQALSFSETIDQLKTENNRLINRYEILTENLAAAIIIRDADGNISYCSPYTEVLTGYSLGEIYDMEEDFFLKVIHDEDREIYQRALKVTAAGEAFQFQYRFFHRAGIPMWAETRTVPILSAEGEVLNSLSITLDVTGTVRYQHQVEEKNRDLQDFTYMVTHDLKAPIYTLKGMVNLVQEDFLDDLPEELQETLAHIGNAAKRLEDLVTSVLEYSRLTALEIHAEPVSLKEVVDEVIMDYAPQIDECKGQITVRSELPTVIGEKTRIYQVFGNLVGNAIKYRSADRPLEITISATSNTGARYTTIRVDDNGSGIPEEMLESIFRPFHRAQAADIEGSGIGLACVKKILDKFGGEVEVESSLNRGSSFSVSLKVASTESTSI